MKGKFITFEGSEGCGKSTQSKLLKEFLEQKGFSVLFVREPGGTKISEKIREILLDAKNDSMTFECEMLLYMAARAQIAQEVIKPALEEGKIVLCDRFLDSTKAYQGYGLGIDLDLIKKLGKYVCQNIVPDLTILLDVPLKEGLAHRESAKDRIEQRPLSYHERVRNGYFSLARSQPKRIKIVKVEKDKFATQEAVRRLALAII